MEYRELVAVTGLGGLYQLIGTKSDGAIVRNIGDKTTKFISSRQHNVTPLESIEVYTTGNNVYLHEVFEKMKENEAKHEPLDAKANNDQIKEYFSKVFPEMDEERVYVSDMKKMLKWYVILKDNDLLNFEKSEAATAEGNEEGGEEAKEAKPKKKAAAKKSEAKEDGEEAAPKKTAKKKAAAKKSEAKEDGEEKPKKTAKKKTEE